MEEELQELIIYFKNGYTLEFKCTFFHKEYPHIKFVDEDEKNYMFSLDNIAGYGVK